MKDYRNEEGMRRYPGHYETCQLDMSSAKKGRTAAPRQPTRSLAEFAREVGVSVHAMTGFKGNYHDFPTKKLQSGRTGYYVYAELKAWWEKHQVTA